MIQKKDYKIQIRLRLYEQAVIMMVQRLFELSIYFRDRFKDFYLLIRLVSYLGWSGVPLWVAAGVIIGWMRRRQPSRHIVVWLW